MAHRYLSHTGSNTAPYESPATAATTLTTLSGPMGTALAVDEHIWVAPGHTETGAAAVTYASPTAATATRPQRLLCVSDFDESPETLVTTPSGAIRTSGANSITFRGYWYVDGLQFWPGNDGAVNASLLLGDATGPTYQVYDTCSVYMPNHGSPIFRIGAAAIDSHESSDIVLRNFGYRPRHSAQSIYLGKSRIYIDGLYLITTNATAPTSLFACADNGNVTATIINSDLSALAYTNLVGVSSTTETSGTIDFVRCKLRSGAAVVSTGWTGPGLRVRLMDCDSGNTRIRYEAHEYQGLIMTTTSIYASTDPSNDGVTPYSHAMLTNANASRFLPLYSEWVERWAEGGTAITPSFEILVSSDGAAALTNADVWIEVQYQSDSTSPLGSTVTDAPAQIIDAGTEQAAGTTAWTGHGLSNPRTHRLHLNAPITPNKSGYVRARVALAKPNTSIFMDQRLRW